MSALNQIYEALPVAAQNASVSLYGLYWRWLRFGPGYQAALASYLAREHFNHDEWRQYQQEALGDLLFSAANHVPYYMRSWSPADKQAALHGDLSSLPLLEKSPIRENPRDFIRNDLRSWPNLVFNTSGSTGTPIASYWKINELRNSIALREARSVLWAGASFKLPRATFSGRMVEPRPESPGPFYRYNAAERQVYFSAFHVRPETAPAYVDALWKHRVQWMTGYAVSFYLLARLIVQRDLKVPPLLAIVTTSEKLTPEMRTTIQQAFHCRVFEEYSTVENALFASECEAGRLHSSPDVAIVEILRPDGSPCDAHEVGEVVTTCLIRKFQPLIRFRLGDLAAWDDIPCECGRSMPVIKEVVGRIEDVVIGPDGRQMVRFHGVFIGLPHVVEGQVIQEKLDRIRVRVVPATGFSDRDREEIINRVRQRLGDQVEVELDLAEMIPRTRAGKFQAVVSELMPNEGSDDRIK